MISVDEDEDMKPEGKYKQHWYYVCHSFFSCATNLFSKIYVI